MLLGLRCHADTLHRGDTESRQYKYAMDDRLPHDVDFGEIRPPGAKTASVDESEHNQQARGN